MGESASKLTVVVLGAGRSTRMGGSLPKICRPIAGRPIISRINETLSSLNPAQCLLVINPDHETPVDATLGEDHGCQFIYQEEAKGTGHALKCALSAIPEDHQVLILLGDVPFVSAELLAEVNASCVEDGLTLVSMWLDNPSGFGRILCNDDDRAVAIVEEKDANEEIRKIDEVFTGIMAVPAKFLHASMDKLQPNNAQGEYYLTDLVGLWNEERHGCSVIMATDVWRVFGVNTMTQLQALEWEYAQETMAEWMSRGVQVVDASRVSVHADVDMGEDVTVDVGVVLQGRVVVGDGAVLGPYCVIKDSVIETGAVIKAHSVLDGARVSSGASVGPMAYLRPGAEIGEEARAGAFVEVKNSEIGRGSKVNHLSYIGDATLGENVNIGAGTITANYDGVNKHRTLIGDGCHVGANNTLIAPVELGEGATTGGGSTLSHPVPSGALAIERAKVRCVENWRRPCKVEKTSEGDGES